MIRLMLLAIFMVSSLSACDNNEESSIRKIEEDAAENPNIMGDNYNKLVGYSGIIGRAKACGIDTKEEQRRVSDWIDKNTTPGSMDNQMWHLTFAQFSTGGVNAQQRDIETDPKSCDRVLLAYTEAIPWPE